MARGARGEEVARSSYEGHAVTVLLATFLFTQRSVDHRCPRELTFFVRLQVLLRTDLSALKKKFRKAAEKPRFLE